MADWIDRFSLQGRTALVTGASRGIGAKICNVFADAGADIVAVGRDEDGLQKVSDSVKALERNCHTHVCELSDPSAIDKLCDQVLTDTSIDILVNNAGVALISPALEASLSDWDMTMAVNVRAAFLLAQRLAPAMIEQRWGKIINISSQAGVIGIEEHTAYSASKAAMNAMTRGLMSEWARHNVQVNAICPTVILTDMGKKVWGAAEKSEPFIQRTPLRRFGEEVEVADMALYLASDASALVNGETLLLDGGFSAM
jgi:NAD(P)-dependent dehydrogenase (short-subunit alcohol dehydrogenase family)